VIIYEKNTIQVSEITEIETATKQLATAIVTVGDLLQYTKLTIPVYQRPYKWSTKNVIQLLDDVIVHKKKSAYRLGTIVIHEEGENLNIVDGQQRTITLILITKAVLNSELRREFKNPELINLLKKIESSLINPAFSSDISISNIQTNYREIERLIATMDEETIHFLFTRCEFIQFVLSDISEAFQFFDSQNARGKDLEPHDLLKAYHLREFSAEEEPYKNKVVETWESMDTSKVSRLFGEYLYRIKGWAKGNSSRYFTKNEVGLFKGINMSKIENYPYTEIVRIAHYYVDHYNGSFERNIDKQRAQFPFQLDQTIINGKRFFEMVTHYKQVFDKFLKSIDDTSKIDDKAREILTVLNSYEGRGRVGDQYIRTLFDCAIIYYIDKFGFTEISRVIEKIFIWAYTLRLRHQAVYLASVDNYVVDESNVFRLINDAINPNAVLTLQLPIMNTASHKSSRTGEVEHMFKRLKYYDE
jgi:uncharacterized protein with ParB-like and HNH nuclease domain